MTTTVFVLCCAAACVLFVLAMNDDRNGRECSKQAADNPLMGLAALGYPILAAKKRGRAYMLIGFAAAVHVISSIVGAP